MALISTIQDDFNNGATIDPIWSAVTFSANHTMVQDAGELKITSSGGYIGEAYNNGIGAYVRTVASYDLTGSSAYVLIRPVTSVAAINRLFKLISSGSRHYYIRGLSSGLFQFVLATSSSVVTTIASVSGLTAATGYWFRIREDAGTIYGDYAVASTSDNPPAPGDWVNIGSQTKDANFNATSVQAQLQVIQEGSGANDTRFDGFNGGTTLPPPSDGIARGLYL